MQKMKIESVKLEATSDAVSVPHIFPVNANNANAPPPLIIMLDFKAD